MPHPPLTWRRLAVPKRGHRPDEYEDAAAGDGARGRFAVADGATESAFAGEWARRLAESFVLDPRRGRGWAHWLPEARRRWLGAVGSRQMPWYLEEKARQGAFAALLGLELGPNGRGWEWHAVAVGDCCLFHLRRADMVCSFPVDSATEFNSTPELVGSASGDPPREQRAAGRARPGDTFLLATDAIAHWALRRHEQGRPPWAELLGLDELRFPAWVEGMRERGELRNDDVTLLAVQLPGGGA